MAFELLYKLRTKKFWWLDIILYFVLALLIAIIISYLIFGLKIFFQKKQLQDLIEDIAKTGTEEQKNLEKKIFEYQKKIDDFSVLLNQHQIPSNFFGLFEQLTLPNVWFSQFSLAVKESNIVLSGETESLQSLAHQLSLFEENEFFKDIKIFSLSLGKEGKIIFNLTFSLDPKIFTLSRNP